MKETLDLVKYFKTYHECLEHDSLFQDLYLFKDLLSKTSESGGQIFFAGNGASAAIASHVALDFTKQASIKSTTFHDPALITAFTNDFGGDFWLSKACQYYVGAKDLAVFISVSGESPNVVEAAKALRERSVPVVSFTGKSAGNSLRRNSDLSFWVNSDAYNIVECIHMIWITTVIDMVIGRSEYSVS